MKKKGKEVGNFILVKNIMKITFKIKIKANPKYVLI